MLQLPLTLGVVSPYVDPGQLNLPWPQHSYLMQPARGYMETVPAATITDGLGIVWNLPDQGDNGATALAVAQMLRSLGFSRIRIEVPWDAVSWDEAAVNRPVGLFEAFAQGGLRPIILLNANDQAPGPYKLFTAKVTAAVAQGANTMVLDDVSQVVAERSGLNRYEGTIMACPLIIGCDTATKTVTLSKPCPRAFAAGDAVNFATLKYLPFDGPGTANFAATMAGWLKYVGLVTAALQAAKVPEWDFEVWNELSFGSQFLDLNAYWAIEPAGQPSALSPGGKYWEIAAQTQRSAA